MQHSLENQLLSYAKQNLRQVLVLRRRQSLDAAKRAV
jgi:hypothetical protein